MNLNPPPTFIWWLLADQSIKRCYNTDNASGRVIPTSASYWKLWVLESDYRLFFCYCDVCSVSKQKDTHEVCRHCFFNWSIKTCWSLNQPALESPCLVCPWDCVIITGLLHCIMYKCIWKSNRWREKVASHWYNSFIYLKYLS